MGTPKVVATHEITTAGDAAKIEMIADRDEIAADGRDLVYLETNILDADDIFVPTADNRIEFAVEGPGEIVGVDNGNAAASDERYKDTSRFAFNGKALVIVQSKREAGDITVTAASEGLISAGVTVRASEL